MAIRRRFIGILLTVACVGAGGVCDGARAVTVHAAVGAAGIVVTPPTAAAAMRAPGQTRLSDSRPGGRTVDGTSSGAGPLSPGAVRRITVTGRAGVATTGAVVLNIQAVAPRSTGYLTAWPCAQPAPATSVLNVAGGGPSVANTTILALGTSALCVRSTATTDLVVDLAEQFSSAAAFTPTGGRVIDSRTGLGGLGRLTGGLAVPLPALGADFVNVTAVNPAGAGYLSVLPCDVHFRFASTVNFDGATTANVASVVRPDMCVTSSVDTDLVIDRIGSMQTSTEGLAHGAVGGRLVDTRNPPSNEPATAGRLQAGVVQRLQLYGAFEGWPARAGSVAINLTTARSTGDGTLQLFKCGGTARTTAAYPTSRPVSHLTFIDLSHDESFCVVSSVDTDLIVDGGRWFTVPKRPLHVEANEACYLQMAPATITLGGAAGTLMRLDISGGVAPYTVALQAPTGWALLSVDPAFDNPQSPILELDVQDQPIPLGITTFTVTVTDRLGVAGTLTYALINDGHPGLPGTC